GRRRRRGGGCGLDALLTPRSNAPCWSGRVPVWPVPVTNPDRRRLGGVPDRSPAGLGSGVGPLPGDLDRAPHVGVDAAAVGGGAGPLGQVRELVALLQLAGAEPAVEGDDGMGHAGVLVLPLDLLADPGPDRSGDEGE